MKHETWNLIKNDKNFNVNAYRGGLAALVFFLILSTIWSVWLFYLYLAQPEPDYYATSGITPPVALKSMPTRNNSSQALLAVDPSTPEGKKWIPE